MSLLLCAFGAFLVVQVIKALFWPKLLHARTKIFLAVAASYGIAAALFTHHTVELVVYGAAGAGLGLLIHRLFRLLMVLGDYTIREISRKTPR